VAALRPCHADGENPAGPQALSLRLQKVKFFWTLTILANRGWLEWKRKIMIQGVPMQMNSGLSRLCGLVALLLVFLSVFSGCQDQAASLTDPNEPIVHTSNADPVLVSAYTGGLVPAGTPIICAFVHDQIVADQVGKKVPAEGFVITPGLSGEVIWSSRNTIEFKPHNPPERQKKYVITINPDKLGVPELAAFKAFNFSFSIKPKLYVYRSLGFTSTDLKDIKKASFNGLLEFSDLASKEEIESSVKVEFNGQSQTLIWDHADSLAPRFRIDNLSKTDAVQTLTVFLQGPLRYRSQVDKALEFLPAFENFKLRELIYTDVPERSLKAEFTHPLQPSQDLRGLIRIEPTVETRVAVSGSTLTIYLTNGGEGDLKVTFNKGIKNAVGEQLPNDEVRIVQLKPLLPAVRFIGKGVIVPRHQGVSIPIETVNLNAVIVSIEKIHENRVGQFLQVNELDGSSELSRVGTQIWKKVVPVGITDQDHNRWIRTTLDLSPVIGEQDHSLYRISLHFDVRHVEFSGQMPDESRLLAFNLERLPMAYPSSRVRALSEDFWVLNSGASRSNRDWDGWYSNRNNPWHPAFYQSDYYYYDDYEGYSSQNSRNSRTQARNVVVSDLGIIAQADSIERYTLAVSSLLTAMPVADAEAVVYNYQLQEIARSKTDKTGMTVINLSQKQPFLVEVRSGNQRGYLRLQGSSNLPVSHFDVAGQELNRGIRGYIYGERGVWRPGNDIYLTFVLWDKHKVLPAGHPVNASFTDPLGKTVKVLREIKSVGNFYPIKLSTNDESITGNYQLRVQVGGNSYSQVIPVEAIKPNRLKITLDLPKGVTELKARLTEAAMQVNWLHGAPASNLRVEVMAYLRSVPTVFKSFEEYRFADQSRTFSSEEIAVLDDNLDQSGKISVPFSFSPDTLSPGKLLATVRTRAYEQSGDFSTDIFSVPYSPYNNYAGLFIPGLEYEYSSLNTRKENPIKLALVDSEGKGLNGKVKVDVYRVDWRWWWDSYQSSSSDYLDRVSHKLLLSESVTLKNGKADWNLKFTNEDWGMYYLRVTSPDGHYSGQNFYAWYSGWDYNQMGDAGKAVDILSLKSDKTSYKVGETAKIQIPSAAAGQILVTMENSGKIIKSSWYASTDKETTLEIPVTTDMTPNVYLHISLLQPYAQNRNDRPMRMFGILPLMVENPDTRLQPQLVCKEVFEPDTVVPVTVSEASGKPMTYTLAMVDEGLLGLTRFKTPNAWDWFFRREASAVRTFDLYSMVAGALNGNLERLLAIGGSEEGDGKNGQKANRFRPVVQYLGPFELPAGSKAQHDITIPQYIGAVRLMLVAGNDSAFGSAEKSVPVKRPLMVLSTLPRVISVTEKFSMPVTVFALEPQVKDVAVTIKVNDKLILKGKGKQNVQFKSPGEKVVTVDLEAGFVPGKAVVEIQAQSGSLVASQTIELEVRFPTTPFTNVSSVGLEPGASWKGEVELPGLPGSNSLVVEASLLGDLGIEQELRYLIRYPYGCVEQTTSSVFPQLYLDKFLNLSADKVATVRSNIQAGVNRLVSFQTTGGGLSYWPGYSEASLYGTVYAAHFLFKAHRMGYYVPETLRSGLVGYLKSQVQQTANAGNEYVLSYALYDLVLAGSADLGAMNRLRESRSLGTMASYKLAAAYALAGHADVVDTLLGVKVDTIPAYRALDGDFGSDVRDLAILAEGLIIGGKPGKALPLIIQLGARIKATGGNTHGLAYALMALGEYLSTYKAKEGESIKLEYDLGTSKGTIETAKAFGSGVHDLPGKAGKQSVTLKNHSKVPVFVRLLSTGQPGVGMERESNDQGLSISAGYYEGQANGIEETDWLDVKNVKQGMEFNCQVVVNNESWERVGNVALDFLVPSGWEIVNTRFENTDTSDVYGNKIDTSFDYQDVRDDRVYTFFSMEGRAKKVFTFKLHATYAGTFYLPAIRAHAMYNEEIRAAVAGTWVSIHAAEAGN